MGSATRFVGADAMRKAIEKLRDQLPDKFAAALYQEAEIEATECKRRCPVETGALRASIHVEGPTRQGKNITAAIVAGGPSAPYGLVVHEDLEADHDTPKFHGGEAKFIERPLHEAASHMAERIAKRIDLNDKAAE